MEIAKTSGLSSAPLPKKKVLCLRLVDNRIMFPGAPQKMISAPDYGRV